MEDHLVRNRETKGKVKLYSFLLILLASIGLIVYIYNHFIVPNSSSVKINKVQDGRYMYETQGENINVSLGEIGTNGVRAKVSFSKGDNEISFRLNGGSQIEPVVKSNMINFSEIRSDLDLVYKTGTDSVIQQLILKGGNAEGSYSFDITGNLKPQLDESRKVYVFSNDMGEQVLEVSTVAKINRGKDVQVAILTPNDNDTEMLIKLDGDLIYGSDAKFPIEIEISYNFL